jgi:uncharacterized delta-60 repeat protein
MTTFTLAVTAAPGSVDLTWGTNGISAGLMEIGAQATGIAFQKSGLAVVGGYAGMQFVVARYTDAGALDKTFGTMGKTETMLAGTTSFSSATGIVVDANDRIVQAGSVNGNQSALMRFVAAGTPDNAFGTTGQAAWTGGGTPAGLRGIAFDATGNILTSGFDAIGSGRVYRSAATGTSDTNWGSTGYIALGGGANAVPYAVVVQTSGRIVAFDALGTISGINAGGTAFDTTFGTTGQFKSANAAWYGGAVAADGSLLAVGSEGSAPTKLSMLKLTKDGKADTSFNGTGIVSLALGDAGQDAQANGVAIQTDGKIVVVGNAVSGGRSVMAVLRFNADGSLDSKFGPNGGIVFVTPGAATAAANAVAIGADGRIYVAGHGDMDFAVARIWP